MEILFLFCFSLHNIEEALWLPAWSKYAGKYHKEVGNDEFRFAVIAVTALGYLATFQYMIFPESKISVYIYSGFVLMMVINAVFPHLLATLVLRRYAPGTMTGLLLNMPVGIYILYGKLTAGSGPVEILVSAAVISSAVLFSLKYLFAAGRKLSR